MENPAIYRPTEGSRETSPKLSSMRATTYGIQRRPRGETFLNCLLFVIIFFGGIVWAYFHFMHNRNLDNPTTGHNIVETVDAETTNIYRKKMITDAFSKAENARIQILDLYKLTKKKNFRYDDSFDQEVKEITDKLRTTINDMKLKTVPKKFEKPHLACAEGVGELYKALNNLHEMVQAETPASKESYTERFNEHYKKGKKLLMKSRARYGKL